MTALRIVAIVVAAVAASEAATGEPRRAPSELLMPLGSTSALMCEPAFSSSSSATWYRDGLRIASVYHNTNVNYENRTPSSSEEIPPVGFLTIYNISKKDAGRFWCRRDDDGRFGELFVLRVAFVDAIPTTSRITYQPKSPLLGQNFYAHCPLPDAYPELGVSWSINDEPLAHISSEFEVFPNGSLHLPHFSPHHFGLLRCRAVNFAGNVSTSVLIDSSHLQLGLEAMEADVWSNCAVAFRSSLFMFLLGCLVTSCCVLLYLVGVVCWVQRHAAPRLTLRPTLWSRDDTRLAPGFRKAVVPLPDCFAQTSMLP